MKDWKLIEAIGKIDERYIMEADEEASLKKEAKIFFVKEKTKRKLPPFVKTAIAACFMLSVVLPNVSEESAYALQSIPGLGRYFQLITLRKYSFNDGSHSAEVKTPYLAVEAEGEAAGTPYNSALEENIEAASLEEEELKRARRNLPSLILQRESMPILTKKRMSLFKNLKKKLLRRNTRIWMCVLK